MKILAAQRMKQITAADEGDAGQALLWLKKIFGEPKKVKREALKNAKENPGDWQEVEWDNDVFTGNLTLSPGSSSLSIFGVLNAGKNQTSQDINANGINFTKFKKDLAKEIKNMAKEVLDDMEDAQAELDKGKALLKIMNKLM